jgi:hypothetical protein
MRHFRRATLVTLLTFTVGCQQDVTTPSGPVTVTFVTPTYTGAAGAAVSHGTLVMDGVDTVHIPEDSLVVARGGHSLSALLDIAYLPTRMAGQIAPSGPRLTVSVPLPASCRTWAGDSQACYGGETIASHAHLHTFCPANDFGDFCSWFPDSYQLGLSWPADVSDNQYLGHARLLVGAVLGADAPAGRAGDTLAMALVRAGDYAPRVRLHAVAADSSRWQLEAVTDMRQLPASGSTPPSLNADDRAGDNFGLDVRTTYAVPASLPNAILVRFDLTNVSATANYRRVHPEEPLTGHTLHDVWLAPTLDPTIACGNGSCTTGEDRDDNATVFSADSLLVAYDQEFSVPEFGGGFAAAPALLGLRVVDGPAGAAPKAVLFDLGTTPDFATATLEHSTYRLLSGGRAGAVSGCTDYAPDALVCSPETKSDIRMAWSVGPIASLAPGETTHLTVAIVFASPVSGTFTSGTGVAPGNTSSTAFSDTTRAIWKIGASLRAAGDSTRGFVVDTTSH